jgi:hypothetical protein
MARLSSIFLLGGLAVWLLGTRTDESRGRCPVRWLRWGDTPQRHLLDWATRARHAEAMGPRDQCPRLVEELADAPTLNTASAAASSRALHVGQIP